MKTSRTVFPALFFLAVFPIVAAAAEGAAVIELKEDWALRSSAGLAAGGEELSLPGVDLAGWYPARVPTTVLSALVKNDVYRDIYFADNFKRIPE
ncbi:MAG: hypothetical protein ACYDH3_07515 [Candidatus Aminicenantales bacterium]